MAEDDQKEENHHRQYGFIIPAGALIGLGVGLLADNGGLGLLIGLGGGFLCSGLVPLVRNRVERKKLYPGGSNLSLVLIGAFLLFLATGIMFMPAAIWPYAIAGFLVLIGFWVLVKGLYNVS